MSPEELAEIEALAAKASPGPWAWVERSCGIDKEALPGLVTPFGDEVCNFGNSEQYYPTEGSPPNEDDSAFIANARADVPALLADVHGQYGTEEKTEAVLRSWGPAWHMPWWDT